MQRTPLAMCMSSLLIAAGCPGGGSGGGGHGPDGGTVGSTGVPGTSTGTSLEPETPPATSLDSTGSPVDPCSDDYDGNHELASALALGIEATEAIETAQAILGDQQIFGFGNEQGEDRLVVCPDAPDFFSISPVCAGYLGVDLRRQDEGALDLYLYSEGTEVTRAVGTWHEFYLKPLHRGVSTQTYTIEVRHASGGAQPYSLEVYLMATAPCS